MAAEGFATLTFADYDNERSTFRVRIPALTAVNFDATNTLLDTLESEITGICVGVETKWSIGNTEVLAAGPASSQYAARELKWLIQYHDDTTGNKYTGELPCPDQTALDPNDRSHAEIGDASVVDDFVTAFEALVLSPDGNSVTIDEITLVGRNL